ncbi:nucleotidyltransferase family protein [bacterium]|nr:nucleotidyltransferase family protein [bacterium]
MTVLDRMVLAVERVRQRLLRASRLLEQAGVAYAVVGGNAVAAWVATTDPSAVRNTQDVDLLIQADDLPRAIEALRQEGFIYRHAAGLDMFLDGPDARARDALHIVFAGQKIRPDYLEAAPDLEERQRLDEFYVLKLEALVRMKLTSFRRKDQVHLLDLIGVGLLDERWPARFPQTLAARLQELLDNPDS